MEVVKQYHLIYKITNLINGKIYIGKHSTYRLDDGYMGTGVLISKAIKSYGKENFKKEIVYFAKSSDEALEFEELIVDETFIKRQDVYNLQPGGMGAPSGELNSFFGKKHTEEHRKFFSERQLGEKNHWFGKKHSEETKNKMRKPKPKTIVCCPYCDKTGALNLMKRWHFDNCKEK